MPDNHGQEVYVMPLNPLTIAIDAVLIFIGIAILGPVFNRNQRLLILLSFSLACIGSLFAVWAGIWAVNSNVTRSLTIGLGLPDLPFHLRIDPLSGFFLFVIGLLTLFVSIYSIGYLREFLGRRSVLRLIVFYSLFEAGMFSVVLSDDALIFLISWEIMAAASYFLVLFEDERIENRRAAFLYMVMAHVGAIAILLSFGVMAGLTTGFKDFSGYTFDAMRAAKFPAGWAAAAFLLSFFGFAAKAGVVPLHIWLPEAHPVAPSNVSALMSGVMLKTAIYGIVRINFDLIGEFPWWWGAVVLLFGLGSAVMGVLYAMMQNDLKRMLAYSSVENIGIILIGVGFAMIFSSYKIPLLAALALTAGLYHAVNHAMFKGLLFMGAGSVLHATHRRNMEDMGGLIHHMPWTAALFLIGSVSISSLPPFNGFVSEWLTFQAFLLSPSLPEPLIKLLMPLGAALLALTAALAAAAFVRAFGVVFLGHWRSRQKHLPKETNWPMRIGMILSALACLFLGVIPSAVIGWMDTVSAELVGEKIGTSAGVIGWMWLTPISYERASYSGMIVLLGILSVYLIVYFILHIRPGKIHRVPIWDCGFEKLTVRMQYTATAFAMPFRRIFGALFYIKEQSKLSAQTGHRAFPQRIVYVLRVRDRLWNWLYQPVSDISFWISRRVGRLQQGRIQAYLIYSFVTIIVLLLFVK